MSALSLYHYRAKFLSNYDGDTVRVDIDLGFNVVMHNQVLRLYGINTPEVRGAEREFGKKVKAYVYQRLHDADEILIETSRDRTGKFGRWLATIWIDGVNLNEELVSKGMAKEYMRD